MNHDVNLVQIVHKEIDNYYELTATLSRYGGLTVLVTRRKDYCCVWQGENILEAREWINNHPLARKWRVN